MKHTRHSAQFWSGIDRARRAGALNAQVREVMRQLYGKPEALSHTPVRKPAVTITRKDSLCGLRASLRVSP